jgi:hypothetical protein
MLSTKAKRISIATLFVGLTVIFLIINAQNSDDDLKAKFKGRILLENYKTDEERMIKADSQQIFFLESHLDGVRILNKPRQACSLEAAGEVF